MLSSRLDGVLEILTPTAPILPEVPVSAQIERIAPALLQGFSSSGRRPLTPAEALTDLRQPFDGWFYDPYAESYALGRVDDQLEAALLAAEAQRTPGNPLLSISPFKQFVTDFWGYLRARR